MMVDWSSELSGFSMVRGRACIAVFTHDLSPPVLTVTAEAVRGLSAGQDFDLILSTTGGEVEVAARLTHFLRHRGHGWSSFVVGPVMSAGTLCCLGSSEIVLDELGCLGPVDPWLETADEGKGPRRIGARDVRGLVAAAQDWFDVDDRRAVMEMVLRNVSGPTVARLHAAEQRMLALVSREVAFGSPSLSEDARAKIVASLVTPSVPHDAALTVEELIGIGLEARRADVHEQAGLRKLQKFHDQWIYGTAEDGEMGVVASSEGFLARHVVETQGSVPTMSWIRS